MTLFSAAPPLVLCVVLGGTPVQAQGSRAAEADLSVMRTSESETLHQLAKDLSRARKVGDLARVRGLEGRLLSLVPGLPEGPLSEPDALPEREVVEETVTPLWGNDVKIYSGAMNDFAKRQIAIDADTTGGIYVALNSRYSDSCSDLRVYRSTNGGSNWIYLGGWNGGTRPILSLDLCVTDTADGKWLLGYTFVVNYDRNATAGGHLYWGSMLSDGSNRREKVIYRTTPSTSFRNPSICTDGTQYPPKMTYHYIAAEFVTPSTGLSRGLVVTRSSDWGISWSSPDSSISSNAEATPVIAIDWSAEPDSLCIAFTRHQSPGRDICMARNSFLSAGGWAVNDITGAVDEFDPSIAIDPARGDAIVTYTRNTGAPTHNDVMYLYSRDLFETFTRDSIATGPYNEDMASVSYAPDGANYYWRVAYRTAAGEDTIVFKSIANRISSFHAVASHVVSQYRPAPFIAPAVGFDLSGGPARYLGNCIYVGYGPQDVYFDASDLWLDVSETREIPVEFVLHQNYPNPFNPKTHVRFQVPGASDVRLTVFDQLGREVAQLVDDRKEAGTYTVQFDGARHASGIYYYRLEAEGYVETKKFVLLK